MTKTKYLQVLMLGAASIATMPAYAAEKNTEATVAKFLADDAAAGEDEKPAGDDIIVTGTRASGITQAESATPIKLVSAEALSHVGQPNLNQVLTQLVPSFTAQAFGGDTANLTLSARLRGLSPNHTLVLVNGKRRHGTSNLAVLGGPFQGGAAADLDLISPSSIKRVEVLEDGAAAQYGSDAIAGVINIILKDDSEGGDGYVTAGRNYTTGGDTYAGTLHLAAKLGDSGFINATLFHRFSDRTLIGGLDRRVTNSQGVLLNTTTNPALTPAQQALYAGIPGFPFVNLINGNARSWLTNIQVNAAYDFGGLTAYAFGTYSKRNASSFQNFRVPDRILGSPVLGVSGVLGVAGTTIPFPLGFNPREAIREDDFGFTAGVKGVLEGFDYDLSLTYGQDKNQIFTLDSANRSLFIDTGFTPRDFYNGFFRSTELTVNADFKREVEIGFYKPLNIAFGIEYRRNAYTIGSGDPGSIYKEGGQAYPGFRPTDAGTNRRDNISLYLDLAAAPTEKWTVDGAVRFENYSDFGSNVIFKLNSRYDFSDVFALRGTISTGFRAPTLAESFYSATNVSPVAAFVQLPANSAAAKLIGFQNLRPEKSFSVSLGTVIRPTSRLTMTLDAYQVEIKDRILGTGSIFGSGGATNFPIVTTAIRANGNILDPTVTQTGINIFTNGADTRTRGIEATFNLVSDFGSAGKVNWTLSGNYNQTQITRIVPAPATLTSPATGLVIPLFDQGARSNLETASPVIKAIAGATWSLGGFTTVARATFFGTTKNFTSPNGGTFYEQRIGATVIADLEVSYALSKGLTLAFGANNLFDKRPPTVALVPGTTNQTIVNGGNVLDAPLTFSPYGINGGYYYGRINISF